MGNKAWWNNTSVCGGGNAPSSFPSGCVYNRTWGSVCLWQEGETNTYCASLASFAVWTWQGHTNKHTHIRKGITMWKRKGNLDVESLLASGMVAFLLSSFLLSLALFRATISKSRPAQLTHACTAAHTVCVCLCMSQVCCLRLYFSGVNRSVCVFNRFCFFAYNYVCS